jgi:hypothetical protein
MEVNELEIIKGIRTDFNELKEIMFELKTNQALMFHTLEGVLEQTTKTNGRVTNNENEIIKLRENHIQCPINIAIRDIEELKKADEKIQDETMDARWAQRFREDAQDRKAGVVMRVMAWVIGAIVTIVGSLIALVKTDIIK